jgi:gluconate 2-dehydrogenase gamma chain
MTEFRSRREFVLRSGALFSGAWLTANWPLLESMASGAWLDAQQGAPFKVLTPAEARTMAAFAEQIVPSNDTPGAREAGAIYFIDRALGDFSAHMLPDIRTGLKNLDERARRVQGTAASFADLSTEAQIKIMRAVERSGFFGAARTLTVMGVFADPSYGGNRNNVGHRLVGMEHRPTFQPPFGYYDAQAAR